MLRHLAISLFIASGLAVPADSNHRSDDTPVHAAITFNDVPEAGARCGTQLTFSRQHLINVLDASYRCSRPGTPCIGSNQMSYPRGWINTGPGGSPKWKCGLDVAAVGVSEFPLATPPPNIFGNGDDPKSYRLFYSITKAFNEASATMVYCGVAVHAGGGYNICDGLTAAEATAAPTAVAEL